MRGTEMAQMNLVDNVGQLTGNGLIYAPSATVDAMLKAI